MVDRVIEFLRVHPARLANWVGALATAADRIAALGGALSKQSA